MSGRIGLGGFLGVTALIFGLAFVGAVALPHDPYIRYQSFKGTIFDRLGWVYERLAFSETPIEVLVVGSSRSARGINAEMVERDLAAHGTPLNVANISLPAAGIDIRLTKIREALEDKPGIRLVIFGLNEALPRDGHQAFGDLGSAGDILTAPWLVNRTLPANIAGLPYRQMELALATLVPEAFGYRDSFAPGAYLGDTPDHRLFDKPDWTAEAEALETETAAHAEAVEKESNWRRRGIRPPVLPDSLGWIEFGVSRSYVRQVADLVEAHGAKLVFIFPPFFQGYDAPLDANWIEGFGPIWSPDFVKSDPRNYADAAHMSQRGVELVTLWISDLIRKELELTE